MVSYIIIAHRINTLAKLAEVPVNYGVEIDVRHNPANDRLYLNHDPAAPDQSYADLEEYLAAAKNHAFVIFNIKEAGIEQRCLDLAAKFGIGPDRCFLLDVEFPYIYRTTRKEGVRNIAIRYSEAEPIEMTIAQKGLTDWVWIDTNTRLPLDADVKEKLAGFKACLVSPDRWRPDKAEEEILAYRRQIEEMEFPLTAVMVGLEYAHLWE